MNVRRLPALAAVLLLVVPLPASAANAADWRLDPAAVAGLVARRMPTAAAARLDRGVAELAGARELGASLLGTRDLATMLLTTAARGGITPAATVAAPAEVSIEAAGARLVESSGAVADTAVRASLARLAAAIPDDLEATIAELASAMADAAVLRAEAFSALTPVEMETLERLAYSGEFLRNPSKRAVFEGLAARVDVSQLLAGAAMVLRASQQAIPVLRAGADRLPASPPAGPPMSPEPACGATDLPLPIWIGTPFADCWTSNHILAIDPAGDDVYNNNAGATYTIPTPGPVAVLLDLEGKDSYHSAGASAGSTQTDAVVEGAGVMGVGVLVDVTGDDSYNSFETLVGASTTSTVFAAQGAGIVGVGVHADVLGSDAYNSFNQQLITAAGGAAALRSQAVQGAAYTGVGLHADLGAEADYYNSVNTLTGPAGVAVGTLSFSSYTAQGAVEVGPSAAASIDVGGDDRYNSSNAIGVGTAATSAIYEVTSTQGTAGGREVRANIGAGILVNGTGNDLYNSDNTIKGRTGLYTAQIVQGAAVNATGAGIMVEGPGAPLDDPTGQQTPLGGSDRYNSGNAIGSALGGAGLTILNAQGVARPSLATGIPVVLPSLAVGVLADVGLSDDLYNSANIDAAKTTTPSIQCTLGCVHGEGAITGLGVAVMADLTLRGADEYNSENTAKGLTIRRTQGAVAANQGGPGVAVMLELDLRDADHFNAGNSTTNPVGINLALGASQGGPLLDVAVFADTAGSNLYNTFNTAGITPLAMVASGGGVAAIGVFADLLGPDTFAGGGAPSFCAGPAVLVDIDGATDVPPTVGPPCLLRLDT